MLSALLLIILAVFAIGIITIVMATGSVFLGLFGDVIIVVIIVTLLVKLFRRKK